jgi:undecaprenyl-diphosphatase
VTGKVLVFDTVIRTFVLASRNDLLTSILVPITYLGNSQIIIIICTILLFLKNSRRKYGFPLAITTCISVTIQTFIKVTVHRPRPDLVDFLISQGGYSFPSGHSCTGLVFYGLFAFLVLHNIKDRKVARTMAAGFICLFLLIGVSRIYVGVHYPTDVLGGWSLGTAILMTAISVIIKMKVGEEPCPHLKLEEKENI